MPESHTILTPARLFAQSIEPGYIRLDDETIARLGERLADRQGARQGDAGQTHWLAQTLAAPDLRALEDFSSRDLLIFVTVFHTIGFCYWPEPRWTYTSAGTAYDGAAALLRSLYRLCRADKGNLCQTNLLDATSDLETFESALGGQNKLPLLAERHDFLKRLVQEQPFDSLLLRQDALDKAFYIKDNLPGFDDVTINPADNLAIPFLKRAQLLTSDIDYILRRSGPGLDGMHDLTAFADYKVPQLLRHLGVLVYGSELSALIDTKTEIAANSRAEVAIRAFTLLAVDKLQRHLPHLTCAQIDSMLWLESQSIARDNAAVAPYHRTITCAY